jgi:hypothetical protein
MSPRNIKDLLKMRHAVESIRNRKSTTGANNQEFIQSLKNGSSTNAYPAKQATIKRTPSNESATINATASKSSSDGSQHQVQK